MFLHIFVMLFFYQVRVALLRLCHEIVLLALPGQGRGCLGGIWDTHAGSESEQIEFTGESERNVGAEDDLEGSVVDPGYENAAICSLPAEQGRGLLQFAIP